VANAGGLADRARRPAAPKALASLRHRDFRLLMLGQLISAAGDQMQTIGLAWHVYVLTNSPLQLGLLGLFRAVPFMALFFSLATCSLDAPVELSPVDRGRRMGRERLERDKIALVESRLPDALGEIEITERSLAKSDRDAEQRTHRGVVRWKTDRARIA